MSDFPELDALAEALEPAATAVTTGDDSERALLSIAVSLKRIADELSYSAPEGRSNDPAKPYTFKDLLDVIAETHA